MLKQSVIIFFIMAYKSTRNNNNGGHLFNNALIFYALIFTAIALLFQLPERIFLFYQIKYL